MKSRWVLVLCLLLLFLSLPEHSPVRAASAQSFSNVYLSPVSYNSTSGSSFTVNVMLNLVAGQNISGFDIKLNYSNPQPTPIVRAENLYYAGNIFGDNFVSTECVPLSSVPSIGCQGQDPTDTQVGWVHFSALANSGNPVTGPLTGLLFSVKFSINPTIKGSSLIHIFTADLGNSGSGAFATTQFIPRTTEDAIFSNSGVTAFFNYLPTDTPSIVVGHSNSFDATGSFNGTSPSTPIKSYNWDFGDGKTNVTATPIIPHTFVSTGQFRVNLTVTDANGAQGWTRRIVSVGPALGALLLAVYSLQKHVQSGVLVRIFNSSAALSFKNATTDTAGQVTFQNLSPGVYTLAFSGPYVKNSTATATIIAGWTTQNSVGVEVDPPPSPGPPPWYGDILFLASLGGALGLFGLGLFFKRRSTRKKLRSSKTSLKKR